MTGEGVAVPYTAWEQAVFVVFLGLFVVGLLYWFTRQQGQWQRFIAERDEQWQTFLREQRDQDQKVIRDLIGQVRQLAEEMKEFRADFNEHNTWEHTKLEEMTAAARRTGARK